MEFAEMEIVMLNNVVVLDGSGTENPEEEEGGDE